MNTNLENIIIQITFKFKLDSMDLFQIYPQTFEGWHYALIKWEKLCLHSFVKINLYYVYKRLLLG
jgi:hypothetical protein